MSLPCDHPRPKLDLPGRTPERQRWSPPSYIPNLDPNAARVIQEALKGIYAELARQLARSSVVPLIEDLQAIDGQTIVGVGAGQVVTLPQPLDDGTVGSVRFVLDDITSPVTVVNPDGSSYLLDQPGIYDVAIVPGTQAWTANAGVTSGGVLPAHTWAETLAAGATSGASNPIVDAGQFLQLGSVGPTTNSPQVRSGDAVLRISATNILSLSGGTALQGSGGIVLVAATGGAATVRSDTANANLVSTLGDVVLQPLSTAQVVSVPTGFLRFTEAAASTPSMSAGQGLFWNINSVPNRPMFTDDTNADFDLVLGVSSTSIVWDAATRTFQRAALTGAISAAQDGNGTLFAGIRDNGSAENDRTNLNFLSTTSIVGAVADDAGNDELEITFQRAALTGAISASQNSNATLFAGILDNGAAENDRTNLNFLTSTSIIATVTDDAGNDELELNWQRAALTGDVTAAQNSNATTIAANAVTNAKLDTMAANTVKANATAGTATPTDVAVSSEAVLGRTSGNITSINSAVQTILMRAAGSVFWGSCAADQTLRRSGSGDLGFGTLVTNNIGTNQVTMARIEQVGTATFLGRATAGTGNVEILTSTQATANLNVFTSTLNGLAPSSGGGTTNFLRADGTWNAPPSGSSGFNNSQSTTLAATTNNFALSSATVNKLIVTLTGSQSLTGIVSTGVADGAMLWVINADTVDTLTVSHDNASSTAANRIQVPGLIDCRLDPGGTILLAYSTAASRWQCVSFGRKDIVTGNNDNLTIATSNAGVLTLTGGLTAGTIMQIGGNIVRINPSTDLLLDAPGARLSSGAGGAAAANTAWLTTDAAQFNCKDSAGNIWKIPHSTVARRTTIGTVTAATTALSLVGGAFTIPANSAAAGTTYRLTGHLCWSRGATVTALNVVLGVIVAGTNRASSGNIPAHVTASAATSKFHVEGLLTVLTTGAGGTAIASLRAYSSFFRVAGSNATVDEGSASTASFAFNTTITNTLDLTAAMSAAVAATTLTAAGGFIERVAVN